MKYIIVKTDWQYNDCYYEVTDSEAYHIVSKLYDTKQDAESAADELNVTLHECGGVKDYVGKQVQPYKVIEIDS